jgi:hypothetical protein
MEILRAGEPFVAAPPPAHRLREAGSRPPRPADQPFVLLRVPVATTRYD